MLLYVTKHYVLTIQSRDEPRERQVSRLSTSCRLLHGIIIPKADAPLSWDTTRWSYSPQLLLSLLLLLLLQLLLDAEEFSVTPGSWQLIQGNEKLSRRDSTASRRRFARVNLMLFSVVTRAMSSTFAISSSRCATVE